MAERWFLLFCGRWLPWRHNGINIMVSMTTQFLITLVFLMVMAMPKVDSIYYPGQGYSVTQDGAGVSSGWNPGQGQPVVPGRTPAPQTPYDITSFTHNNGGSKQQNGTGGPIKTAASKLLKSGGGPTNTETTNSFNSFIHQPSSTVNNRHQQPPSPTPTPTNNLYNQQRQPATSPAHILFLLQALRSRVNKLIPQTPTPPSPSYYTNYLQPQPTPGHYNHHHNHYNHHNQPFQAKFPPPQPQPTALQTYQTPSVFLPAPVPPRRPVAPTPPPYPSPFQQRQQHQPFQQYMQPPPLQPRPQNRPPPQYSRQPPPQPHQSQAAPPQSRPPARTNYYSSYRHYPIAGGECGGFAPPGQLCCDGIRNILPKGTGRQFVCCSKTYFDPATQVCCGDHPVPKPKHGPPQRCCGHMLYDPRTSICCDKFPIPNPGGLLKCCTKKRTYNPAQQMCCGESIKPRLPENKGQDCCGKHMYNPATHLCCGEGNQFPKTPGLACCGKNTYSPSVQMCCFGDAMPKGGFCFNK